MTFTQKFLAEEDWLYQTYVEWPWYVGTKYACIMNDYYETSGGTYAGGFNTMSMYKVDSLGKSAERERTTGLFNLLSKATQNELRQIAAKYNNTAPKKTTGISSEKKVMDLDSLVLARKNGKWIIKIPVFSEYSHEGNGSNFSTVEKYVDYEKAIPKELTGNDTLCIAWKDIVKAVPKAVDAVSSPSKDLLVVLTNSELLVYKNPKLPLKTPQLRINVGANQRIVLNQWASGDEATRWKNSLDPYFNGTTQSSGIVYNNSKLGFSFTMPSNWANKYRIEEVENVLRVYFKPSSPADEIYTGALFYILVRDPEIEDFLDTVGQPRFFKAKAIEYIVGGPTDVTFDFNHPEFNTFSKMTQEVSKVVATIKILN